MTQSWDIGSSSMWLLDNVCQLLTITMVLCLAPRIQSEQNKGLRTLPGIICTKAVRKGCRDPSQGTVIGQQGIWKMSWQGLLWHEVLQDGREVTRGEGSFQPMRTT